MRQEIFQELPKKLTCFKQLKVVNKNINFKVVFALLN